MIRKKEGRQVYELKLRGHKLQYRYLKLDGSKGDLLPEKEPWEFKENGSLLPRPLFFKMTSYVMRYVKTVTKKKSVSAMMKEIERGLHDAAKALGCQCMENRALGDVTWFLDKHRFFAFQIEDLRHHVEPPVPKKQLLSALRDLVREHSHHDRFVKMEKHSKALCRGSFVVLKHGRSFEWKFVPGAVRGYHIKSKGGSK